MRLLDKDFEIRFPFVATARMTGREFLSLLVTPRVLAYMLIVFAVHTSFNPDDFSSTISYSRVAFLWLLGSSVYVSTHLLLWFFGWFVFRNRDPFTYHAIGGTLAATVLATYLMLEIAPVIGVELLPKHQNIFGLTMVSIMRMVMFEWIFFSYILKRVDPADKEDLLQIGDREISMGDLLYIRANEHRVCFFTKSEGEVFERARMKDLLNILDGKTGIQPHRSYWVPRPSISAAKEVDDKLILIVEDGTEITVARTRRGAVEEWLVSQSVPYVA